MGTPVEGGAMPQARSDQPASGASAIGDIDTEPDIDEDDEEETTSIEAATPVERPADESPVSSPPPAAPAYEFDPFAPPSAPAPAAAPTQPASAPEPSTATASDAKPASEDVHATEPRDPSDSNS